MSTTTPRGRSTAPTVAGVGDFRKAATAIVFQGLIAGVLNTVAVQGDDGAIIGNQATALNTDNLIFNVASVYVNALGGGEIYVEGAGYNLAATWNVAVYISVRGAGWAAILNYNAAGNCITFTGDNAKVKDIKIVIVAGAGAGGTRPNGILADTRTNIELNGVWVIGDLTEADDASEIRQCGAVFDTVTESRILNSRFDTNERHGIILYGASNDNLVSVNFCEENGREGINLDASHGNTITGNTCPLNLWQGIALSESDGNTVTGNTCQGGGGGIWIGNSSNNAVTGNTCNGTAFSGIDLGGGIPSDCTNNTLVGNTCNGNETGGIALYRCDNNTLVGNTCNENTGWHGVSLNFSDNNTVKGNTCQRNEIHGICLDDSSKNTVVGNSCNGNDSGDTGAYSGINVTDISLDNKIHSNTCNDNDAYGIDIDDPQALRNWVKNNTLIGNGILPMRDSGTNTKLATLRKQFVQGTTFISADGSAKGWEINAEADMAIALEQLPLEVQQVVRIKIWAVALGAPVGAGGQMHLDIVIQAGVDNLAYTTENISLANFDSVTTDYVNTDVVHWSVDSGDDADIDDLVGGMSLECKINGAPADAPDEATNATFRVMEIEVV